MKVLGVVFLVAALIFSLPYAVFFVDPLACLEWMSGGTPKPSDLAKYVVWSTTLLWYAGAFGVAGIVCLILGVGSSTRPESRE